MLDAAEAARAERAQSGAAATASGASAAPAGAAQPRGSGGRGRGRRKAAGPEPPPGMAAEQEEDDGTIVQLEGLPDGVTLVCGLAFQTPGAWRARGGPPQGSARRTCSCRCFGGGGGRVQEGGPRAAAGPLATNLCRRRRGPGRLKHFAQQRRRAWQTSHPAPHNY